MTNDRADKSGPGELAVAAQERERVLAENAQEMPKLGKRTGADVIEIGRRLTEMKKLSGHGNWLPVTTTPSALSTTDGLRGLRCVARRCDVKLRGCCNSLIPK
jgi:hypothetical protein